MLQFQKHFTLEEARALLPSLRQMLNDTQLRRKRFAEADEKLGKSIKGSGADLGGRS